jgi:hypothetical protein
MLPARSRASGLRYVLQTATHRTLNVTESRGLMTADRRSGAEPGDRAPEHQLDHHSRPSAGQAERSEPAEGRGREEYYDAQRAAADRPADASRTAADDRSRPSGWDTVDPARRPPPEALRLSPERVTHILDGDVTGGGHRHGAGSPGRTEFPAHWSDDRILGAITAVARHPESVRLQWNERWRASGQSGDVWITAIIRPDGAIWTSWPEEGSPGVVRNPEKGSA